MQYGLHIALCTSITHTPYAHRYESARSYWLVLEFCVGGCLADVLKADRRLPEAVVRKFGLGLAASLQYCHSQVPECCYSPATPTCWTTPAVPCSTMTAWHNDSMVQGLAWEHAAVFMHLDCRRYHLASCLTMFLSA